MHELNLEDVCFLKCLCGYQLHDFNAIKHTITRSLRTYKQLDW